MRKRTTIEISDRKITVRLPQETLTLPGISLPASLIAWLEQGRSEIYRQLQEDPQKVDFFQQHLPVLVTRSPDTLFPFNCGNKGVGFLPAAGALAKYTDLYRETIAATRGIPWQESLAARIAAARSFHEDRDAIDFRCLTSIEIFQRRTFTNLQQYPLASLLFTGASPEYRSFQLNCAVEIIDRHDPRFAFIRLSRRLFEFDAFHIAQPDFHFGYLFWLSEVIDKTPHRVAGHADRSRARALTAAPVWDDEALSILHTLPAWSRFHVREQIEKYSAERGFSRVTAALVAEARKVLRH